tara:strand:- start:1759 stop:2961 length:1203 start_codon:yes stop_codon:yes gene_type:complete
MSVSQSQSLLCEVCGSDDLEEVLDLGEHPLCGDLVRFDEERTCKEYPIVIKLCNHCKTAHQVFQVPKTELFHFDYGYRARSTGSVLKGMSDLVDSIEVRFGNLAGKKVLDIGCNDGSLLNFFQDKGAQTFGVEPTGAANDSRHPTINSFFDADSSREVLEKFGKPDFVTFTNVFAHIEDLRGLLKNLKTFFSPETKLIIENHYLGACLSTGQFDTFYHEHPRTYSKTSFEYIARNLEMNLLDVEFVSRYGGNIRAYIGMGQPKEISIDETDTKNKFKELNEDIAKWKVDARKIIDLLIEEHGKIKAKAFPGRAAILIKLLNLTEKEISAVYEIKGSLKVNHYIPGTRIPILPESELYSNTDQKEPILNLAWHLPSEVRANLKKNGYLGDVIDIKEATFLG